MATPPFPIEGILRGLRERAKELSCLCQIDEILGSGALSDEERLRQIVLALPGGLQYPEHSAARIESFGITVESPGFLETPSMMVAPLTVRDEVVGGVTIVYTKQTTPETGGPFLEEERKLLEAVAEQVSARLALGGSESVRRICQKEDSNGKWKVILGFLEQTDPQLLQRMSHRMANHLRWRGVAASEALFDREEHDGGDGDAGQPLHLYPTRRVHLPADEVFRIATEYCGEEEILQQIRAWINKDKLSFLITALEAQESSLDVVAAALRRLRTLHLDEQDLPSSVQDLLKVGLLRKFFTDDADFLSTASRYATVDDFHDVGARVIMSPGGAGKLGGKASGLFLARKILERAADGEPHLKGIRVPRTWYIASDVVTAFIRHNDLDEVLDRKYMAIEEVRRRYPYLVRLFKSSPFPPEITRQLSLALDDLNSGPLIVRSSSLLENRTDAAFPGKYRSLFLANRGSKEERLRSLQDAVAEIFASVFGPEAIEYRRERHLLDVHEGMGVLIQELVGTQVGDYFLPAYSGVALSHNEFRWSPRIEREDGLIRLVPGLGTRAVERLGDDYPILLVPEQPGLRVNTTPDEVVRYSPKMVDVFHLEERSLQSVPLSTFLRGVGSDLPLARHMVSFVDRDGVRSLSGATIGLDGDAVVTFEGLANGTPFVRQMAAVLRVLKKALGTPVEVEFASDGEDLYLLQCRPQSSSVEDAPDAIPRALPRNDLLFSARRFVSNGRVPDITHVVYVDPTEYVRLGGLDLLRDVGRAVGRLNAVLPKRQFILMGPGRWGSRGDIRLGVSVTYSDINNTALLIEIARRTGNYVPDLSFGTHFFHDLVEARIRYLPLYPDEPENHLNEAFLRGGRNLLPELVPELAHISNTVRVLDIPAEREGQVLKVLLNADLDEAVGVFAHSPPPSMTGGTRGDARGRRPLPEPHHADHWQWRLQMAERLAGYLDGDRFGVVAMWVMGSTKNATAGPGSDIDLIVHFDGTARERAELLLWLEGWSLSLAEINYLRTGYQSSGLLDVHLITDEDIANRSSYAAKIGAVTDAARPLRLRQADE